MRLLAVLASMAVSAVAVPSAHATWSGTITWKVTASGYWVSNGPTAIATRIERTEDATYTLNGALAANGSNTAQMVGSTTSSVWNPPPSCVQSPWFDWSYNGPAKVTITYAQGQFLVFPVPVTVTTTSSFTNCGQYDIPYTSLASVPGYGGYPLQMPTFAFAETAPAGATTLTGSKSIPWTFTSQWGVYTLGTVTISWNLTRPPPLSPHLSHAAGLYWCVNLANSFCASSFDSLPIQTSVSMICWRDGSSFTGIYTSARWFYVIGNGKEGFVHSSYVQNQVTTPNCSTIGWMKAADWAIAQLGSNAPTAAQAAFFDRTATMWNGYCYAFVWEAWYLGAGVTLVHGGSVTALSAGNNYANAFGTGTPPRGAVVFWSLPKGFGHAAISIGNGWIVSTNGINPPAIPIKAYTMGTFASLGYRGWYRPS